MNMLGMVCVLTLELDPGFFCAGIFFPKLHVDTEQNCNQGVSQNYK